jgi:glycosyltransferase involved in cell wall biosynthesis
MKKTRILVTTPLYPPQVGGPASRTVILEKKFPEMGFVVSIAKFSDVLFLPKIIRHIIYFFIVILKGIRASVVVAQDPVSTGFPSFLASKILFKKFVLIIVGDYAWEQGSQRFGVIDLLDTFSTERTKYPIQVRLLKKIQFFVASHANKVIVPSFYLKKIVTNWGISGDKIQVIYNSFEPLKFDLDKVGLKEKYRITDPIIVSSGRLVPWKGFSTLISGVMPKVISVFPNLKLFIVGDGPDRDYLNSLIQDNKLENNVFLVGRKPQNELFEYIKMSEVFVLNTAYEGMSHQLLEVMALGTPIVTTNIGGNSEIIVHDKEGVLVDFDDANAIADSIIRIINDKEYSKSLVENSKNKIKEFSEEKMLKSLSDELR